MCLKDKNDRKMFVLSFENANSALPAKMSLAEHSSLCENKKNHTYQFEPRNVKLARKS
jgi:hypothetical protein